ncbi:helix-turn-helix domain-containing protein [Actinacidiphila epipremni]|uniref:Helix-turn-helix domain-containing protein n=1 Tax=Actinacidiphila epipremni TaxID=2053013 RepID=A0ABX0ZLM8_9ACTN|nr:helix-turn-helix transcriptional regulator [Actinacidiphila epipremni]NJP43119.1 helix-turn-helix domain-containing protein [Actinacidiphila epipremni]
MPPRSNPSARQQRLGSELRKLREDAGLTTEQAAALLDTKRTVISSSEAGRHGVSPDRVRRMAFRYGCADQALVDALVAMCGDRTPGWWENFRGDVPPGFLDIAELEWHARGLRVSTMTHMPGQLQTEDYARALFAAAVPELPAAEFEARVAHRVQRGRVLDRPDAPPYELVVHECVLHTQVGGPAVLRAQLGHLMAAAERPNVTLQVLPFSVGAYPGSGQGVLYARGPVPRLDTVLTDRIVAGEFHHTEPYLHRFRLHFDQVQRLALPPAESLARMHALASRL